MAACGTLVAWATVMGHTEAADLLQQNLDEEKAADEKLTVLAESGINEAGAATAHPGTASETRQRTLCGDAVRKMPAHATRVRAAGRR